MSEANSAPPPFDVTAFLLALRGAGSALGEPFHYYAETESTNDQAKRAAATGAPSGSTFLADFQTQGRGRHGRQWLGQPNTQLLASVLWRPGARKTSSSCTLAVGVALHRVLTAVLPAGAPLQLKWPNDIEFRRGKLAGVLVEQGESPRYGAHVVVGFGINVLAAPRLSGATQPVSLAALGIQASREALLAQCLRELASQLSVFETHGSVDIVDYVNRHHALTGETVTVGETTGEVLGVSASGALVLSTGRGQVEVTAGTVERI